MNRTARLFAAVVCLASLFGCGGGSNPNSQPTSTPIITSMALTCTPAQVGLGQSSQCTPSFQGSGSFDQSVTFSNPSPNIGTISGAGVYTAPATASLPTQVTITAKSNFDASKTATATITVVPPVSISITPSSASVPKGGSQQFAVTLTGTSNLGANWFVNDVQGGTSLTGTITTGGLYAAPANVPTPATVTVKAVSAADATKSATATVTITEFQRVQFYSAPGATAQGVAVALDPQDQVVMATSESIPGSSEVTAGLTLYSADLATLRAFWSHTPVPSTFVGVIRNAADGTFFAAGTTGGGNANPALRAAWLLQFSISNGTIQVVHETSFQLGGKRTEVKALAVRDGKIYLGTTTDDLICGLAGGTKCSGDRVVVLDTQMNRVLDFPVGNTAQVGVGDSILTGIFAASDHLWVAGNCCVAGAFTGFYMERWSLNGQQLQSITVGGGNIGSNPFEDSTGNLYLAGTDVLSPNDARYAVTKQDQTAHLFWGRSWNGDNTSTVSVNTAKKGFLDPNGNPTIVGSLSQIGSTDPAKTDAGIWVVDSAGNTVSQKRYSSVPPGTVSVWNAGAYDSKGNLILSGTGTDGTTTGSKAVLLKQ